jgi:uncharacterized protein with von Willebrand factor type A (vWA) domain
MEHVLQNFITALRGSGVRISVSESIDAMNAMKLMGYDNRQILKDSLSAALAKTRNEKETFYSCFDRFFSPDGFSSPETDSISTPAIEPDKEDSPLTRMLVSRDNTGLSLLMRQAAEEIEISGIWFFTQKSMYVQRILKGMGGEGLDRDIKRFSNEHDGYSQEKARVLKQAKDLLFENVRNFVERQFSLFAGSATEKMLERYLRDVRLSNLEKQDFQRMHVIIKKMVKRLNNLHSRRRKSSKRGALDLKKTLRENVAYQGLIFDPQWKARKIDRPDLVVLCDVSRSVEAVARFMLLFLYGLNEEVARISSFIFCSNLVEVGRIFEDYPVDQALERLQKGVGLGIMLGRTDYGQALLDFKENWMEKISNKTTVIILGDARNNYGDPQTGIMRLIQERSKRLIWLNPEAPAFWGIDDSEMKRYLPYCYFVRECNTINHLERVVDFLLSTRG